MTRLELDTAILAALVSGCMLYGVFLVLFVATLYVLVRRRRTRRPHLFFLVTSSSIFVFATISEALTIARVFEAFISYRDTVGIVPYLEFWDIGITTAHYILVGSNTIIADLILIQRCWTVWYNYRRIVILPIFLWIATVAAGIGAAVVTLTNLEAGYSTPAHDHDKQLFGWITAGLCLTLLQNLTTTGLIAWRIWSVHTTAMNYNPNFNSFKPVISLIIETGSLYIAAELLWMVTYWSGSNVVYIAQDIMNQVAGITFTLLISKVGLGLTKTSPSATPTCDPDTAKPRPTSAVRIQRDVESGHAAIDGQEVAPVELQTRKASDEESTIVR